MKYEILLGTPQMAKRLEKLYEKLENDTISKDEIKLLKKFDKTTQLLEQDPFYNSLRTHEISSLTKRYGQKVMQSYMENRTPKPWRIYWAYGPKKTQITIIGMERHPDSDKSNAYLKVELSDIPDQKK